MTEHDIVCQECESEFTIIAHNTEETPSYCPFCGREIWESDDEE